MLLAMQVSSANIVAMILLGLALMYKSFVTAGQKHKPEKRRMTETGIWAMSSIGVFGLLLLLCVG